MMNVWEPLAGAEVLAGDGSGVGVAGGGAGVGDAVGAGADGVSAGGAVVEDAAAVAGVVAGGVVVAGAADVAVGGIVGGGAGGGVVGAGVASGARSAVMVARGGGRVSSMLSLSPCVTRPKPTARAAIRAMAGAHFSRVKAGLSSIEASIGVSMAEMPMMMAAKGMENDDRRSSAVSPASVATRTARKRAASIVPYHRMRVDSHSHSAPASSPTPMAAIATVALLNTLSNGEFRGSETTDAIMAAMAPAVSPARINIFLAPFLARAGITDPSAGGYPQGVPFFGGGGDYRGLPGIIAYCVKEL